MGTDKTRAQGQLITCLLYTSLSALKKRGIVKNVILTGDSRSVGESVAKQVGADFVYSELLPEQKVEKIQELLAEKPKNSSLVFVGDGINDAPALACADVGVAMGGIGSDAAVEAADVVIMNDDPKSLSAVVEIAERTQRLSLIHIFS